MNSMRRNAVAQAEHVAHVDIQTGRGDEKTLAWLQHTLGRDPNGTTSRRA
jgi:hypothetical protein